MANRPAMSQLRLQVARETFRDLYLEHLRRSGGPPTEDAISKMTEDAMLAGNMFITEVEAWDEADAELASAEVVVVMETVPGPLFP